MKSTIMIVDDSLAIRQLVASILGENNYEFMTAENGIDALDKLDARHPDLIILDIMMPGMDGIALCKRLREDSGTREIPIIMLTAMKNISSKIDSFITGADEYITKPFDGQVLSRRVETLLRRNTN